MCKQCPPVAKNCASSSSHPANQVFELGWALLCWQINSQTSQVDMETVCSSLGPSAVAPRALSRAAGFLVVAVAWSCLPASPKGCASGVAAGGLPTGPERAGAAHRSAVCLSLEGTHGPHSQLLVGVRHAWPLPRPRDGDSSFAQERQGNSDMEEDYGSPLIWVTLCHFFYLQEFFLEL